MKFTYASGSRPLDGYTVKRGVGRGGFGEVYYGVSDGGKELAMKLIRRHLDVELRGIRQCLNLKHPNLIALYDIRQDERADETWVLMEFVVGESLEQALAQFPTGMPEAHVQHWIRGIAGGVAYLHDHGIVHRDLKPANIFSDEGIIKVGDYGLSKFISCSRRSGQTESVGTVHYMAPEVSNGRYGREIDIYALGVILYELTTGHVPFEGESIGEILMKHLTAEPELARVPEAFRPTVAAALCKDPARRLHTVEEFLAMLPAIDGSQVLTPAGVSARKATTSSGTQFAHSGTLHRSFEQNPGVNPVVPIEKGRANGHHEQTNGSGEQNHLSQPSNLAGARVSTLTPAGTPIDAPYRGGAIDDSQQVTQPHPTVAPKSPAAALVPQVRIGKGHWLKRTQQHCTRAGGRLWTEFVHSWSKANLFGKVLLVSGALVLAVFASALVWPLLIVLAVAYTAYFAVRVVMLAGAGDKGAGAVKPNKPPVTPPNVPLAPPKPIRPAQLLAEKSTRTRATELAGSMITSAIVATVLGLVVSLVVNERGGVSLAQLAWLVLTSTGGAWAILAASKCWEGTEGEPILRRFVLLVIGILVGVWSWMLQRYLLVDLTPLTTASAHAINLDNPRLFQPDGAPTAALYMTYFAFLLLVPRWWMHANPLRPVRLSIWTGGIAVGWAAILHSFWPFPQPWGMLIAGITTIAVQLASPWLDPRTYRKRFPA